jgi:zeaxanthin glucosyltransferase
MQRGHTQHLIGIMQHLRREGHALAVFGNPRRHISDQFRDAAIECSWFPEQEQAAVAPPRARLGSRVRDASWYRRWFQLSITTTLDEHRVSELRRAIREFQPTVVCADAFSYDACVAAQAEKVPWAVAAAMMMSASPPSLRFSFGEIGVDEQQNIRRRMAALGAGDVEMLSTDVVSPWLNMLFSTEALFPRSISMNRVSWFVGMARPLGARGDEPPFPWEKMRADVPVVYVSSGGGHALSYDAETYAKIATSLGPDEAQFVCSVGELIHEPLVQALPDHVLSVRYAPQLGLLERHAAVAVSHGGINSVNEALLFGRPLLVIPISHDQPLQAYAVERSGAGIALDLHELSSDACGRALRRLLHERHFTDAARKIEESYAKQNGAVVAGQLLCRLAREGRPLLPGTDGPPISCPIGP